MATSLVLAAWKTFVSAVPCAPGDRLVLIGKVLRFHRRQTLFNVQGFVGKTMVFHADVIGVPLRRGES